jgi:heat shock protein HtpX
VIAAVVDPRKDRNRQQLALLSRWVATVLALPCIGVVLVLAIAGQLLIGIVVGILLFAGASLTVYRHTRRFGSDYVASLPTEATDPVAHARLHNLSDGLCLTHGVTRPEIRLLPIDSRNAATVLVGEPDREVVLLLTTGLLDGGDSPPSRIELEGVLSQQLSHVRDGDTALSTFVAAVSSVPVVGPLLGRRAGACLDPHLETAADIAGTAMTRYPPGLATALTRLVDHPTVVPGVAPTAAHLWLADPLAHPGPAEPFVPHPPLADRIEVLREL